MTHTPHDDLEGLGAVTPVTVLERWSTGWPGRTALEDTVHNVRLTYDEFTRRARAVSRGLRRLGCRPGDRVAYWMTDRPECLFLIYGAGQAGLVWVPVNHRFTPAEAARQLAHADPAVLVVDAARAEAAAAIAPTLPGLRVLSVVGESAGPPFTPWDHMVDDGPNEPNDDMPSSWPSGILYTSGTTGRPKGAVHTHATLLGWCLAMAHAARWTWQDRIVIPYPFFHMGGVGFAMTALTVGATAIFPGRPSPDRLLPLVEHRHATALVAPPTVMNNLVRQDPRLLDHHPWRELRTIATTSAPLWEETARAIHQRWPHVSLTEVYSATEALFSFLPDEERAAHPRSVGRAALGMALEIRDREGHRLPPESPGLIWGRGPTVFRGYLAPTAERLPAHGWHTCYDVGVIDRDGYLSIIDRLNDLINSGGEKISSGEVEDLLLQHPAVAEAAVIGVPDPLWGERVHAVISLNPGMSVTAEELLTWCHGRLAGFKLPKTVRIVDELPKNAVGKLLKRVLRAWETGQEPPPV
jgi:acyl-CoA synthetase (AMP-forming)/AMP-acid ligase II